MQRNQPTLRPATQSDAEFLAWGLNEAAGGLFVNLLGRKATDILATLSAQPEHAYSYQHATIAETADHVVGFCTGFPFGTPTGDDAFSRAAGIRALRAGVIQLLGRPVFTALNQHAPGQWYLQAIAVRPQGRGSGVGRSLIDDARRRATEADCTALTLDVDAANTGARRLYERLGLRVESTSGRAVLLGGAQVHRMRIDLNAPVSP